MQLAISATEAGAIAYNAMPHNLRVSFEHFPQNTHISGLTWYTTTATLFTPIEVASSQQLIQSAISPFESLQW